MFGTYEHSSSSSDIISRFPGKENLIEASKLPCSFRSFTLPVRFISIMKPQRRAFHLPASPSFPLSVTPHARTLLCARSSGFWVVRLRDVRANKVHLGGSSLPGRLLAGNITSETFLKRIGEMFSLGGWNRSNRHAALLESRLLRVAQSCVAHTAAEYSRHT